MRKILLILFLAAFTGKGFAQLPDGSIAPDFTLTDLNGNSHNLYSYLNQGKTVFIDFFACHCPSCWAYHNQHELENLNAAHGPNGSLTQDVVVLAIEYDANNGTNEFYGISGNTQGNWVSGTTYPFCNPESSTRSQIISNYGVVFYPLVYGIYPDKTIYHVGTQTASQLYTFATNFTGMQNPVAPEAFSALISNNTLFVKAGSPCIKFKLFDSMGKMVVDQFVEGTRESIAVESMNRGIYYYLAEVNGKTFTGKILK